MKKFTLATLIAFSAFLFACGKKTDKDRAIHLVELKYDDSDRELFFRDAKLDSLYNITPKVYADSIEKGKKLDTILAILESQIEHLNQRESDSVGRISAELTEERYHLLELTKTKPQFIGWKLTGVEIEGARNKPLTFNFDKDITKIIP
jgi:hypothetical protein